LHLFRILLSSLLLACVALAQPAVAHDAPVSYLDLELGEQRVEGTLKVHWVELALEFGFDEPHELFDSGVLRQQDSPINRLLAEQLVLSDGAGRAMVLEITAVREDVEDFVEIDFVGDAAPPAELAMDIHLFPAVTAQQTLVSLREGGEVRQQFVFTADSDPQTYYAGTAAGVLAVFSTFVPSGAHHVLIGPDHVLFILGLILLGGSLRRLALIVTAFTLGHSVTLALAATGVFAPPAWLIEPMIALSIVMVGVDNLLRKPGQRDLRALFALLFGLIHGFGFAFVLREFGLPPGSLAASLLAFNIGVELGQLAIVIPLALALAWLRSRYPLVSGRIVTIGSLAVVAAGVYWFVDRVRILGGG
jgi:hypothetical protein